MEATEDAKVKVHFPGGITWKDHTGPCDAEVSLEEARLLVTGTGYVTLCPGQPQYEAAGDTYIPPYPIPDTTPPEPLQTVGEVTSPPPNVPNVPNAPATPLPVPKGAPAQPAPKAVPVPTPSGMPAPGVGTPVPTAPKG